VIRFRDHLAPMAARLAAPGRHIAAAVRSDFA
jgi:hypothetical protein